TLTRNSDDGAGRAALRSSMRVNASRTGRPTCTAQAATSGSISPNLPPNPPPTGMAETRTCDGDLPSTVATVSRVRNMAWVDAYTTTLPSTSTVAAQTCGSM